MVSTRNVCSEQQELFKLYIMATQLIPKLSWKTTQHWLKAQSPTVVLCFYHILSKLVVLALEAFASKHMIKKKVIFFKFFKRFYLFIWEREQGGRAEGEKVVSGLQAEHQASRGAQPHDPMITTWAETKMLNRLRASGTPHFMYIIYTYHYILYL